MIASGYTLMLYCDCEDCENAYDMARDEYVSDAKNCKVACFRSAKKYGWKITKDGKCYAPGHYKK